MDLIALALPLCGPQQRPFDDRLVLLNKRVIHEPGPLEHALHLSPVSGEMFMTGDRVCPGDEEIMHHIWGAGAHDQLHIARVTAVVVPLDCCEMISHIHHSFPAARSRKAAAALRASSVCMQATWRRASRSSNDPKSQRRASFTFCLIAPTASGAEEARRSARESASVPSASSADTLPTRPTCWATWAVKRSPVK